MDSLLDITSTNLSLTPAPAPGTNYAREDGDIRGQLMILRCDCTETVLLYKRFIVANLQDNCWCANLLVRAVSTLVAVCCVVCTVDDIKTKGDGWRMVAVANTDKDERELLLLPAQSKQH